MLMGGWLKSSCGFFASVSGQTCFSRYVYSKLVLDGLTSYLNSDLGIYRGEPFDLIDIRLGLLLVW